MKTIKQLPFYIFLCFTALTMNAQVTVGGQVDVQINIPVPDVVVIGGGNKRQPTPRPRPVPRDNGPVVVITRPQTPNHPVYTGPSNGTIMNQNNGPRFDYQVVSASVVELPNYNIDLVLHLDTGDVMTIAMQEVNYNDYNYHYYAQPNGYNNTIYDIKFNNVSIPMNSAAVSLQPKGNAGYTAVLNLHSIYDGDFNGTVNNVH